MELQVNIQIMENNNKSQLMKILKNLRKSLERQMWVKVGFHP